MFVPYTTYLLEDRTLQSCASISNVTGQNLFGVADTTCKSYDYVEFVCPTATGKLALQRQVIRSHVNGGQTREPGFHDLPD
jgi:hypothetical protein